jgi:hypothetical protein
MMANFFCRPPYNLQQHVKNDTDSTNVVENDYMYLLTNTTQLNDERKGHRAF